MKLRILYKSSASCAYSRGLRSASFTHTHTQKCAFLARIVDMRIAICIQNPVANLKSSPTFFSKYSTEACD